MGRPFKIYNFSQPGYSTTQGKILFDLWFSRIKPDLVILCFGWDDIWPTPLLTDRQYVYLLRYYENPLVRILRKSNTFKALEAYFAIKKFDIIKSKINHENFRKRVLSQESIANLTYMIEKAKNNNASTIIILPPFTKLALDKPDQYFFDAEEMIKFRENISKALSHKATILKLDKMDYTSSGSDTFFLRDGLHPNEKGAGYIGNKIYNLIVNHK